MSLSHPVALTSLSSLCRLIGYAKYSGKNGTLKCLYFFPCTKSNLGVQMSTRMSIPLLLFFHYHFDVYSFAFFFLVGDFLLQSENYQQDKFLFPIKQRSFYHVYLCRKAHKHEYNVLEIHQCISKQKCVIYFKKCFIICRPS